MANPQITVTERLRVWRFSYLVECPPLTESGWVNVVAHNGREAQNKFRQRIGVGKLELGEPVPVLDLNVN